MFEYNGKTFRTLEEQVRENQKDIDRLMCAVIVFNTKGRVDDVPDLPQNVDESQIGWVIAVGKNEPYNYFMLEGFSPTGGAIWTNLGTFESTIPGPKGEQGETGRPGTRGSLWKVGTTKPYPTGAENDGDLYLNIASGEVYLFKAANYTLQGSIRGPQGFLGPRGPQGIEGQQGSVGPRGPQGPSGKTFEIKARLDSITELPTPPALPTDAYLIYDVDAYYLYVWVDNEWIDTGSVTFVGSKIATNVEEPAFEALKNIKIDGKVLSVAADKASIDDVETVANDVFLLRKSLNQVEVNVQDNTSLIEGNTALINNLETNINFVDGKKTEKNMLEWGFGPDVQTKQQFYAKVGQVLVNTTNQSILMYGTPEELATFFDIWGKPDGFKATHAIVAIKAISNASSKVTFKMYLSSSNYPTTYEITINGFSGTYLGDTGWTNIKAVNEIIPTVNEVDALSKENAQRIDSISSNVNRINAEQITQNKRIQNNEEEIAAINDIVRTTIVTEVEETFESSRIDVPVTAKVEGTSYTVVDNQRFKVSSIKGVSRKVNQLIKYSPTSGVTFIGCTGSVGSDLKIVFTAQTPGANVDFTCKTILDHQYYISAMVKTSAASNFEIKLIPFNTGSLYATDSREYQLLDVVASARYEGDQSFPRVYDNRAGGWNQNEIKYVMIIDLTEMYGKGKEPNLAECRNIFYNYNKNILTGLQSSTVATIESFDNVGTNLGATINADSTLMGAGTVGDELVITKNTKNLFDVKMVTRMKSVMLQSLTWTKDEALGGYKALLADAKGSNDDANLIAENYEELTYDVAATLDGYIGIGLDHYVHALTAATGKMVYELTNSSESVVATDLTLNQISVLAKQKGYIIVNQKDPNIYVAPMTTFRFDIKYWEA